MQRTKISAIALAVGLIVTSLSACEGDPDQKVTIKPQPVWSRTTPKPKKKTTIKPTRKPCSPGDKRWSCPR